MSLIALVIEEDGWNALPLAETADQVARAALATQALDPEEFEISLLACSDDRIAALNRRFRGKSGPTNVISWPAEDLAPAEPGTSPRPPQNAKTLAAQMRIGESSRKISAQAYPDRDPNWKNRTPLGDVAIALQTCAREAEAQSISLKNHTAHLILHGCLHLLGYDHGTEADAALMEGVETRALRGMNIKDPYADICRFEGRDVEEAWATTVRQRQ